jgi:flagellar biosynthesis regulator FlaF
MVLRFMLKIKVNMKELHYMQILIVVELSINIALQNWNRIETGCRRVENNIYYDLQYNVLSIFIYFIHDHDKVNNHVKLLKVKPRYH